MPELPRTDGQKQYVSEQVKKLMLAYGFISKPYKADLLELQRGQIPQVLQYNTATDDWNFSIMGYKGRYVWKGHGILKLTRLLEDFNARTEVNR